MKPLTPVTRCFATATFIVLSVVAPTTHAQAENFQDGVRIVAVELVQEQHFYYARSNGDVYMRGASGWQEPPQYLGNFFFGQPVPSDFLAGFYAVTTDVGNYPQLYYASSTGDVYVQSAGVFQNRPSSRGNFFFGQPVPADFQKGFSIVRVRNYNEFYYASPTGDVYSQGPSTPWNQPVYKGNFFNGQPPLATSPSTLGSVKSKYR